MGDGLTFLTDPFNTETEFTGPSSLQLMVSSSTEDADIFAVLRLFAPDGSEVVFQGALDPHSPLAHGWLRASHRKLDLQKSLPYRPYHTHDERQPLKPGQPELLNIEIWPTSIVVPIGYRLGLSIRGRDYEYAGDAATLSNMKNPMRGCGPFVHDDETDRPPSVFGGTTYLHIGGEVDSFLLMPRIP
jgi:predicted acyl esterase